MARQITNQASLTYQYGGVTASAASNIATAIFQETLSAAKTSLDAAYRSGQALTYILTLTNSGSAALTNVQAVDDLGTYTPAGGTAAVTPLTYTGPALLYVNGALSGPITPAAAENAITFTIPSIPAGATAMILYKARVNGNAQLAAGASVQNTVTATADGVAESVSAAHTVTAEDYADVNIVKAMTPQTVTGGSVLTYTFTLSNRGNVPATNVVLTDAFSPAPANISVSINGKAVPAVDYTYTDGVLTLPASGAAATLGVPAASIVQDAATGAVTVTPGETTVVVTGTV